MPVSSFQVDGRAFVVVERTEYDRLVTMSRAAELPALPNADAHGNYPAVEYAVASLARKIIRQRAAVGLTQRELAKRAGVRVETLCRIETGKHTPSVPTIERLDRALRQAAGKKKVGKAR